MVIEYPSKQQYLQECVNMVTVKVITHDMSKNVIQVDTEKNLIGLRKHKRLRSVRRALAEIHRKCNKIHWLKRVNWHYSVHEECLKSCYRKHATRVTNCTNGTEATMNTNSNNASCIKTKLIFSNFYSCITVGN